MAVRSEWAVVPGHPSSFALVLGVLGVAGVALVGLAAYTLREADGTGARSFAAFVGTPGTGAFALVVCGFAWGVRPAAEGNEASGLWLLALLVVLIATTVPWVGFALWYTGQGKRLGVNRKLFAVAFLPMVVFVGVISVPSVVPGMGFGEWWVFQSFVGLMWVFGLVYWNVIHFAGVIAVLRTALVYDHLRTVQGSLVTAAGVVPVVSYWAGLGIRLPGDRAGITVLGGTLGVGFLVTAACLWTALARYDVLDRTPAPGNLGRAALLEEIDDLVFVTDDGGTIVEANRPATEELGVEKSDLVGRPFSEVVGVGVGEAAAVDCVRLNTVDGNREFDAGVSTLTDQRGTPMGNVVTMHDVTDRTIREQRIEVLNRVLRHNLRNKMSIVKGTADYVDRGELPPEGLADGLGTVADEMVQLGEKAREIERVIQEREHMATEVDLDYTVEVIADDVRDRYPGVNVSSSVPEGLTVRTDRTLLSYALENLVENAAEHNDADDPWVEVDVETVGDRLRITVADNGPGIPDHERAVIAEGEETPLEHGSGLGLWATNWCVARLGGELSFEDPGRRGSRVRIELQSAATMDVAVEGAGDRAAVPDDD
ncbi:hypothetical protein BRD00_12795 [Halobacteriales archaeon QS_8_69_26]|nr:MAG: hypothetical protein BRD00_12795 [Halobacteriales archaeon QS_8_69_26]